MTPTAGARRRASQVASSRAVVAGITNSGSARGLRRRRCSKAPGGDKIACCAAQWTSAPTNRTDLSSFGTKVEPDDYGGCPSASSTWRRLPCQMTFGCCCRSLAGRAPLLWFARGSPASHHLHGRGLGCGGECNARQMAVALSLPLQRPSADRPQSHVGHWASMHLSQLNAMWHTHLRLSTKPVTWRSVAAATATASAAPRHDRAA